MIVCSTMEAETEDMIQYEVRPRDIIKFGRLSFLVRHISGRDKRDPVDEKESKSRAGKLANKSTNSERYERDSNIKVMEVQSKAENEEDEIFCRYCWDDTCSTENPIL